MRVCFVDRIGAHAIWNVMGPVAQRLVADGHVVDFVRMDEGGSRGTPLVPDGVRVHDLQVPRGRGLRDRVMQSLTFVREFRRLLRNTRPDIVHTNFAMPSFIARWVAASEGVRVIVSTQHELYGSMNLPYRWGLRLTEMYCAAVVYVSHAVAHSFGRSTSDAGTRAKRPHIHTVISNGVDIDRIQAAIAEVRARVPGRIVCVGRMVPLKGQLLAIEALSEVIRDHPHVQLRLVGSGPLEATLHRRAQELGIQENVEFLGWQPHERVLQEIAEAELLVCASSQEGFGLVVAEAVVCGTPVLASDIPVFREVLQRTPSQHALFRCGDAGALADALRAFPFAPAGELVNNAPVEFAAITGLSAEAMAQRYFDLYEALALKRAA